MVDGIIQEVFKQYYNIYVTDLDQLNMLVNLQSKLIKKIKQESGYFKDGNIIHLKHKIITLEKLIGDNQE